MRRSRSTRASATEGRYTSGNVHMTTKEQILHAIEALPEEVKIEDAIERGLAQADAGATVSQEYSRERMARCLR